MWWNRDFYYIIIYHDQHLLNHKYYDLESFSLYADDSSEFQFTSMDS